MWEELYLLWDSAIMWWSVVPIFCIVSTEPNKKDSLIALLTSNASLNTIADWYGHVAFISVNTNWSGNLFKSFFFRFSLRWWGLQWVDKFRDDLHLSLRVDSFITFPLLRKQLPQWHIHHWKHSGELLLGLPASHKHLCPHFATYQNFACSQSNIFCGIVLYMQINLSPIFKSIVFHHSSFWPSQEQTSIYQFWIC